MYYLNRFSAIFKSNKYSEGQRLALPAVLISSVVSLILFIEGFLIEASEEVKLALIAGGLFGAVCSWIVFFILLPNKDKYPPLKWIIVIVNGILIAALILIERTLQSQLMIVFYVTLVVASAILFRRWPTYLFSMICFTADRLFQPALPSEAGIFLLEGLPIPIIGIVVTETILYVQNISNQRVKRLEVLNMVARSVSSSLEIEQVIALLNSTIQMALDADTYYVGLSNNSSDHIHLELLYDEGEFFPPTDLPLENTLAGWVIRNKKSLFLTNLPNEMPKLGIERFVVGRSRASLSWIGTVMQVGGRILGIVAVASYSKNAFSREDLELLENVALQASLAIDNAYHHSEVELKSRLDSLTGALNHRAFIQGLENKLADTRVFGQPMSVIMLDVDHFKKYNDHFGHLVGDQVLFTLTSVIRTHIRENDIVGRWGGEEFSIALAGAELDQSLAVAQRIQQTLSEQKFFGRDGSAVPAPTVSQGIAVYPADGEEPFALIDTADQRLYIAKNRGRNEIEPNG